MKLEFEPKATHLHHMRITETVSAAHLVSAVFSTWTELTYLNFYYFLVSY